MPSKRGVVADESSTVEKIAAAPCKKRKQHDTTTTATTTTATASTIVYNSDEEPPPPEENDRLNWRLDPEESHSDWTIRITTSDDGENDDNPHHHHRSSRTSSSSDSSTLSTTTTTYHVHKHIIAVGSKKCEYFSRLFKNSSFFSESNDATSSIRLDSLAANAFPTFLDYMYSSSSSTSSSSSDNNNNNNNNIEDCHANDSSSSNNNNNNNNNNNSLSITTSNATALYYLGKYFENRRLRWLVKQFWSQDINVNTCDTYYVHAKRFHNDKILNAVAEYCTFHIHSITPNHEIVQHMDVDFLLTIVQPWLPTSSSSSSSSPSTSSSSSSSKPDEDTSRHLSRLIARFCSNRHEYHDNDLIPELFLKMTNDQVLPVIDPQAAMELMAAEKNLIYYNPATNVTNTTTTTTADDDYDGDNDGHVEDTTTPPMVNPTKNRNHEDEDEYNRERRHQQSTSLHKRCSEALSAHLSTIDITTTTTSTTTETCCPHSSSILKNDHRIIDDHPHLKVLADVLEAAQREIMLLKQENHRLLIENQTRKLENERLVVSIQKKEKTQSNQSLSATTTTTAATADEIFITQNRILNNEIRCLTDAKEALLADMEGMIPVPAPSSHGGSLVVVQGRGGRGREQGLQKEEEEEVDDDDDDINSNFQKPSPLLFEDNQQHKQQQQQQQQQQQVVGLPSFDRNRSLKRPVVYQAKPFTNIFGQKEPSRCYPIYYFKKGG